ncbi:MAG: PadR family transcriptional regulator [Mogibacterium sp.]|nr:PadR family transcriptional regulator [Mogibacterium sp.]
MAFKIESSLLDACALAILHRGDTYGYEITQEMKKSITVSESTLYPVLRRLQQEQLCQTYDQPYQGRNRRYYKITEKGEEKLRDYMKQWNDYRNAIQRLLDGPEAGSGKAEDKKEKEEPAEEKAGKTKKKSTKADSGKKGAEGGAADE